MHRFVQFALALLPASALACATTQAPLIDTTGEDLDFAAAPPPPQQDMRYGTYEGESQISIGASLSKTTTSFEVPGFGTTESDTSAIALQFGYGYFLSDSLEVGGQITAINSDSDGPDNTSNNIAVQPYIRWNFRAGDTSWFYVGAHTGLTFFQQGANDSETGFGFGAHGGWKLWLSPETAFFIEPRFTSSTFEVGDPSTDIDIDELLTILGFTISI